jgi:hypothetical protein
MGSEPPCARAGKPVIAGLGLAADRSDGGLKDAPDLDVSIDA